MTVSPMARSKRWFELDRRKVNVAVGESCHAAARPSTFIWCFNTDKKGVSAK